MKGQVDLLMPKATFSGKYRSLVEIGRFVSQAAESAGLSDPEVYEVRLAVDEACSNIIDHAYGGEGEGEIQCTCEIVEEGLIVVLEDQGRPFVPESVPKHTHDVPLEALKPHGAGLFLIHEMMDEVHFEGDRASGNVLTMIKRKAQ